MRLDFTKTALLLACIAGAVAAAVFVLGRAPAKTSSLIEDATPAARAKPASSTNAATECLPTGDGFFRARLDGSLEMQIDWGNAGTLCEGMPRPDGNGIRVSFRRKSATLQDLLIVIGVAGLSESSSGRALPANVTIIEEGTSRVFSTRGDDKCTVDELRQELLTPWRAKARSYRVSGRGFCIEPASAVGRTDTVLMSTFDFAGQVTYEDLPGPRNEGPV